LNTVYQGLGAILYQNAIVSAPIIFIFENQSTPPQLPAKYMNVKTLYYLAVFTILAASCSKNKVGTSGDLADSDTLRLGDIYNKSSWTDLADFTETGKFFVADGKIISPVGNNGYLKLNWFTGLDDYTLSFDFKGTNGTKSFYGLPIGFLSVNKTAESIGQYAYFYESTRQITAHSMHSNTDTISAARLPAYDAGDQMRFSIECHQLRYKLTANNITKKTSFSYEFSIPYHAAFARQQFLHNTAQPAIIGQNDGSSYEITNLTYTSNQKLGGSLAVGSSLAYGFNSSSKNHLSRWATLIGAEVNAGNSDKSSEILLRLPEIIRLKPKTVYLESGANDYDFTTWQTNLSVIYHTLTSCGITVIVLTPPPNNFRDMSVFSDWIVNHYPHIDVYTALKDPSGSNLNPLYKDGSDGAHPNAAGHKKWAETIMASPLYKKEPYLLKTP
jgi:lysophospholipase L1-like esterase